MARSKPRQRRCLILLAASLLAASAAFAGRPLIIDDAEPVEPGAYEAEAGLRFSRAPGERHADLPFGLSYGLAPRLEVGVAWGWHLRDRIAGNADPTVSGRQDVSLGFKWMPVRSSGDGLMFALAGAVNVGTARRAKGLGSGDDDYDLTAIVTKAWNRIALDVNLGHTWVGDRFDASSADEVHYGAALRYAASDRLSWVGEVFADDPKGARAVWQANAGVQHAWRKNVVLDAALGRRLDAAGPDWVLQLGFTASF